MSRHDDRKTQSYVSSSSPRIARLRTTPLTDSAFAALLFYSVGFAPIAIRRT
jgi:hypothetical protein